MADRTRLEQLFAGMVDPGSVAAAIQVDAAPHPVGARLAQQAGRQPPSAGQPP